MIEAKRSSPITQHTVEAKIIRCSPRCNLGKWMPKLRQTNMNKRMNPLETESYLLGEGRQRAPKRNGEERQRCCGRRHGRQGAETRPDLVPLVWMPDLGNRVGERRALIRARARRTKSGSAAHESTRGLTTDVLAAEVDAAASTSSRGARDREATKILPRHPIAWLIDFSFLFFMVHAGTVPKWYPVGPKGSECLDHFPYREFWMKSFSIIY